MKNHTDMLIFHTAICAGASQIATDGRRELNVLVATPSLRSGMEITMIVRKAEGKDIPRIMELLKQVNNVHAAGRPDLFIPNKTKYTEDDLESIICDPSTPVFVGAGENDNVLGYAFCCIKRVIGLPGDKIMIRDDQLYINGEAYHEDYLKDGYTPAFEIPPEGETYTVQSVFMKNVA